jgi:hypothetical protein
MADWTGGSHISSVSMSALAVVPDLVLVSIVRIVSCLSVPFLNS